MKATDGSIHDILNSNKQFIVPVYQRMYSWGESQYNKLWDDIIKLQKSNRQGHFVGSIVNIIEQASALGAQRFLVIDGQQRLTTLTILLIALRDYLIAHNVPNSITENFLKNVNSKEEDKYKLILTYNDKELLVKLIEGIKINEKETSRILDAYNFFYEKISKEELTPDEIANAIVKLQIVNITLDRMFDDPQLIFESLNSTGLDLSQSDLIRNYVLMGLESKKQNELYQNIWLEIEKLFSYDKQSIIMDSFFRDYLTMQTGKIPNIYNVYEEFKKYCSDKAITDNTILCMDILKYATFYTNIVFSQSGDDLLNSIFKDIRLLKMEVSYPFLLFVYNDFDNKIISKDDFIEILRLVESYVFRRAICEIPTNSLNKTFATIINKVVLDDYVNSIKAYFNLLDSYKILPKDEEFYASFISKDIYHMRIRNYILSKLERYDNKEKVDLESFTIEHVMPENENLRNGWKEALGDNWKDIHSQYLHTIGNLTLTSYNSEMSDRSFNDKLTIKGGFKDSGLRLNRYIREQSLWNEEKIKERANLLFSCAKDIWAYPNMNQEQLEKFVSKEENITTEYSFDHFKESFSESTLNIYDLLNKRILNLNADIKREYKKLYIAYKLDTNFVDIIPNKSKLSLSVNLPYEKLYDPLKLCQDVRDKGRWGNGDIRLDLTSSSQIDYAIDIVTQSLNHQLDE